VDRFDETLLQVASADIRLVRHDNQLVACAPQKGTRFYDPGQKLKFRQTSRRVRLSIAYYRCVNYSVTIEKYSRCSVQTRPADLAISGAADSHLV
jgi:hypothetical protein